MAYGVQCKHRIYPFPKRGTVMKKAILASAVITALALPLGVQAAESSDHTFTGNVGIFSNYVFRGVTQTSENGAVQGGFDYAHASGVYAGAWGSNISWLSDSAAYTASSLELDVYGGYKATIGKSDFGYDVGGIYYYYPGDKNPGFISADTGEIYAALSWKWITAKVSYAVTDYFGFVDSKGTYYADLSASVPIGKTGLTVLGHVGVVKLAGDFAPGVSNDSLFGYTDWKVGVNYALPKDFTVGVFYADTNAVKASYTFLGSNWADNQVGVFIQKTF